jgi:hypothetical protein
MKSASKAVEKTSRLFARFDKFYTPNWKKFYDDGDLKTLSEGYAQVMIEIDANKIAKALAYIASGKSDFNQRPPRPLELKELASCQSTYEPAKIETPPKTKEEAIWELFFSETLCMHYHGEKTVIACEISALRADIPTITDREFEILSGSPFSKQDILDICRKYKIYLSFVQQVFLESLNKEDL